MRFPETVVDTATQTIASVMGDPLTGNMICAGETTGERDACNGDSGGPLFVKTGNDITQVGIVSWGEGPMDAGAACGHANAYGVYTRLGNYKDWVASTIETNGGPGEPGVGDPGGDAGGGRCRRRRWRWRRQRPRHRTEAEERRLNRDRADCNNGGSKSRRFYLGGCPMGRGSRKRSS